MISFIMMKLLDLINQLNKGSAGESSYNDFGLSLLPGLVEPFRLEEVLIQLVSRVFYLLTVLSCHTELRL